MIRTHFIASTSEASQKLLTLYTKQFGQTALSDADVCVVIGGDGFLLRALHNLPNHSKVYGVNTGEVGFLLNKETPDLIKDLARPLSVEISPLMAEIHTSTSQATEWAFNEVCLTRSGSQAADLSIKVDDKLYLKKLVADGVLIATPSGSTAYNYSAGGPILPLESNVLALTPVCPFSPRQWKGAILPNTSIIEIQVNKEATRAVHATLDYQQIQNVTKIIIKKDLSKTMHLLFSTENSLKERVFKEQFLA